MITGFQLRAAKAALGLTAKEISDNIGVHTGTVIRLCNTRNLDYLACSVKNMVLMQKFFESKNIAFLEKNSISFKISESFLTTPDKMTRFQLKTARIATNLTQEELSFYIKISSSALSILENLENTEYIESNKINIPTLKRFFEHIGIIFPYDLTVVLIKDPTNLVKRN